MLVYQRVNPIISPGKIHARIEAGLNTIRDKPFKTGWVS
jgi:hypothetical protein